MKVEKGVLFLCVANSSRSQMAEGFARSMAPSNVNVLSAGSEPATVNPFAVRAMAEVDIDLSSHASTSVQDVDAAMVDVVVTLCAEEVCPVFLGEATRLHWPHEDPAAVTGSDEDKLASFRRVRDQIRERIAAELEFAATA